MLVFKGKCKIQVIMAFRLRNLTHLALILVKDRKFLIGGGVTISGLLFLFLWYKRVKHQAKTAIHLLNISTDNALCQVLQSYHKQVGNCFTVIHKGFPHQHSQVTSESCRVVVLLPMCCVWREGRQLGKLTSQLLAFFRGELKIHSFSLKVYES